MQAKIFNVEKLGQGVKLALVINETEEMLNKILELNGKEVSVEIKQLKQKRSLDANAYAWVLIGKMADKLSSDKGTIYRQMLERYGQMECITLRADIEPERFDIKYYDLIAEGKGKDGKTYRSYRVYIGSSQYDTAEMSKLIEGIVSEAKELGIETLTPLEIANLEVLK